MYRQKKSLYTSAIYIFFFCVESLLSKKYSCVVLFSFERVLLLSVCNTTTILDTRKNLPFFSLLLLWRILFFFLSLYCLGFEKVLDKSLSFVVLLSLSLSILFERLLCLGASKVGGGGALSKEREREREKEKRRKSVVSFSRRFGKEVVPYFFSHRRHHRCC